MESQNQFKLEKFFSGPVSGWGFTHSRFGKLKNEFRIDAEGHWDPKQKKLTLIETYRFSDGHQDTLEWEIEKTSQRRYVGSEPRLAGNALGKQSGRTFRWRYRRAVPSRKGDTASLSFDDCFLMQDDGVVTASAAVSKFGIQIATVTAFYLKR